MPEEETFAVLVKLMQEYRMRDMYKPTMAELGLCMFQLEHLVQVHLYLVSCVCWACSNVYYAFLGPDSRATRSFSVSKFPHQHVRKLVVSHPFYHSSATHRCLQVCTFDISNNLFSLLGCCISVKSTTNSK